MQVRRRKLIASLKQTLPSKAQHPDGAVTSWVIFLLAKVDLHYLDVAFVTSVIFLSQLKSPIREPFAELAFVSIMSPTINIVVLALSFLALAPMNGLSKAEFVRCLNWVLTSFVAGSILTFLLLSFRVAYSVINYSF